MLEFASGRFMNQGVASNSDFTRPELGYAMRDIAVGEGLTCDYRELDPSFTMPPGRNFAAEAKV